ncbi:hypothetical protein ILUMI_17037 [Ignelater luminosus]|uniref:Uncharacterized protein n=1 Tax=Ignelater luminosus TaxID=2038154 RepID=A0A8K0CQ56_IGNLU|nr:hypothetical protein ILUMI_17037 [Ignelater luminosus]
MIRGQKLEINETVQITNISKKEWIQCSKKIYEGEETTSEATSEATNYKGAGFRNADFEEDTKGDTEGQEEKCRHQKGMQSKKCDKMDQEEKKRTK